MTRFLATAVFLLFSVPAFSMPQFLQMYRSDPFRNPALDGCITCHMSQKAGGVDFFVGHRFSQPVSDAGLSGLFGFDSTATIAFGVRAGITDRLSVSFLRSNFAQTISLGSALQVSRQSTSMPVTLQLRGSVDGKFNFGIYHKCDPATATADDP